MLSTILLPTHPLAEYSDVKPRAPPWKHFPDIFALVIVMVKNLEFSISIILLWRKKSQYTLGEETIILPLFHLLLFSLIIDLWFFKVCTD